MQLTIPATDLHVGSNGEPRVLDTDLAQWLGMTHTRNIRDTIAANHMELQQYGNLPVARVNSGQRGRPASAYYLNEGQALILCALSRTEKAAEVRKALIDTFLAYRQGKVVDVRAHKRRKPSRQQPGRRFQDPAAERLYNQRYDMALVAVRSFRNDGDAMLQLMAGMMARIDMLEAREQ